MAVASAKYPDIIKAIMYNILHDSFCASVHNVRDSRAESWANENLLKVRPSFHKLSPLSTCCIWGQLTALGLFGFDTLSSVSIRGETFFLLERPNLRADKPLRFYTLWNLGSTAKFWTFPLWIVLDCAKEYLERIWVLSWALSRSKFTAPPMVWWSRDGRGFHLFAMFELERSHEV